MSYTVPVPVSGQSLGNSRPIIAQNFATIQTIFDKNHVDFNASGGGKHKYVEIPVSVSIPAGLTASEGTLYTKTVSGASQLFYSPDTTSNEYQLTNTISAQFTKFSTNTAYAASHTGGWTFLPGGMIMNYGRFTVSGSSGTVTFALAFPSGSAPYSLTISLQRSSGDQSLTIDSAIPPTSTGFKWLSSSAGSQYVYWMAIGK